MITETNTAVDTNTAVQNPLGLKKIHHVEFYVGNAKQAEFYYRKAFGFSRHAYAGLETGNRETTSYLMRQGNVNFILTTPMGPEHPAADHLKKHGDGVTRHCVSRRGCRSRIQRGRQTRRHARHRTARLEGRERLGAKGCDRDLWRHDTFVHLVQHEQRP